MSWFLYNVLFAVGYALMLPKFLWRMKRRGGYRRHFMQRLGFYPREVLKRLRERERIWIHAVSVGELGVAFGLMEAMRKREPGLAFVISTTTSTGYALAERRCPPGDVLIYYPADFPSVVRRALTAIQPRAILFTEAELWPNMLRRASRQKIPLYLVNGRISDSSYRGYRLIRLFMEEVLGCFQLLLVQSVRDYERLEALGARSTRMVVTGSVKYDSVAVAANVGELASRVLAEAGISSERPVLVGGSTWSGEEAILLDLHARLIEHERIRPLLILVPRHAERAMEVATECEKRELRLARRSKPNRAPGSPEPDVLLVDSTGELVSFYAVGDVVFVGKSLTQHGGQNILEPAVLGKAILVGPNMENFPVIIDEFIEQKALMQVQDAAGLEAGIKAFLHSDDMREKYGERARLLVESRRGAMAETARRVLEDPTNGKFRTGA